MAIPLAAIVAAMKVGKAAANALSPTGGSPTPQVDVPRNKTPDGNKYQANKDQPQPTPNTPKAGEASTTEYTADKDGMLKAGTPTKTKSNASTYDMNSTRKYTGRGYNQGGY